MQAALKEEKQLKSEAVDAEEEKNKRRNTGVAKSVKEIAESNTAILEQLRSPNATEVAMQRFIIIIIIIIIIILDRYFENLVQEQEDPFAFKAARLERSLKAGFITQDEYVRLRAELMRVLL